MTTSHETRESSTSGRRTEFGPYFEDFKPGDVYKHPLGRTISEADNTWFTLLTMNTNPAHFDAHFAAGTEFGRLVVNSGLTVAIVLGLSVIDTSQNAFANLGWADIRLTHPVMIGDTLYAESRVESVRPSASRPGTGIVTVRTRGHNQDGTVVMTFSRTFYGNSRATSTATSTRPVVAEPWPSLDSG